ncbi:MAG: hypothetical protein Q7S28_04190 [bacterium]|nr:hypothetical protein [bacterium]
MVYEPIPSGPLSTIPPLEWVREKETAKLKEFFGHDIPVPQPPPEITPELYKQWEQLGLELHYLPAEELTEERNLPGWTKKLGARYSSSPDIGIEFFDEVKRGVLPPDTLKLPGAWALVDGREKPQYVDGKQVYEKDFLAPILKDLRAQRLIADHTVKESRFNIAWSELNQKEVRDAFARVLGVPGSSVRLPRAIEWNYLGNAFHPEWGATDTWEWLEDVYQQGGRRLGGGGFGYGGLSSIFCGDPDLPHARLGFRLIVVFPNKTQ